MYKEWNPKYSINTAIARDLMSIEASRSRVASIVLPPVIEAELRNRARMLSTHYSTQIEGNRLTLKEAQEAIENKKSDFHSRTRDAGEVRNYWEALLMVEEWAAKKIELSEDLIKRLHSIVMKGKRAKPTPYRDGQNVIRDSSSGRIIYMPPENKDVPLLMSKMIQWGCSAEKEGLPVPIIAALVHYQFVTIHPYYDGNGRTARLLATFILQRDGYGLNGFFSMEEHHAMDLAAYYNSLAVHKHHNYYEGRAQANLTSWIEYFIRLLADVFKRAQEEVLKLSSNDLAPEPEELRRLDRRARTALSLFAGKEKIAAGDIASALGLSSRMARLLLKRWTEDGWIVMADSSNRGRKYVLSAIYRQFIGNK